MNILILATFWQGTLAFLFILVSVLLIGIVLLQKNRGSGLSGAFGGVGGHSAFGTKTGDFLTWVTVGMVAALLLLAVASNYAFQPVSAQEQMGFTAPPAMPTGTPAPPSPGGAPPQRIPIAGQPRTGSPPIGGAGTPRAPIAIPAPAGGAPAGSSANPAQSPAAGAREPAPAQKTGPTGDNKKP